MRKCKGKQTFQLLRKGRVEKIGIGIKLLNVIILSPWRLARYDWVSSN